MSPGLLQRCTPGPKLALLALAGTGVSLVQDWRIMLACLAAAAAAFLLSGLGAHAVRQQMRPMLWLLVPLFLAQGLLTSWSLAALVVARITTLVLLAALVTLTTRTEDLIATLERALAPFAPVGVNPAKVGLAFALALRFLPVIAEEAERVREAQAARGLGRNPLAVILPLIVRVLKAAEDVAAAIDARSGATPGAPAPGPSEP
ncbi:Transmembrane component BioN of energizing module of biotin ECF transporter [Rhodobacter sp. AKP1]|nr:Transmembrane component BioN of energizing module of biotin ECF transporter [Rhodobacter sp. AKP1]